MPVAQYNGKCYKCRKTITTGDYYQYVNDSVHCMRCAGTSLVSIKANMDVLTIPKHPVVQEHSVPEDSTADLLMQVSMQALKAVAVKLEQENKELQHNMAVLTQRVEAAIAAMDAARPKVINITSNSGYTSTLTGTYHYKLPALLKLAASLESSDRNIWLAGPAGSGKTTAAHQVAKALGLPFKFHGAIDTPYKLTGYEDATGQYRSTAFYDIYKNGGVILLDESDASFPSALLEINAATANGWASFPGGQIVPRHQDCYVICAANTYGFGGDANYVGRAKLDAAFLDRFVSITWPYDETLEALASGSSRAPMTKDYSVDEYYSDTVAVIDSWVAAVKAVRERVVATGTQIVVSPRASIKGAQLIRGGCSRQLVAEALFGRYMTHSAWGSIGQAVERWTRG